MKQTKEQVLWRELLNLNRPFSSVEVRKIGLSIYYTRADRTVRQWVQDCYLEKLDDLEMDINKLNKKIAWYKIPTEYKRYNGVIAGTSSFQQESLNCDEVSV